MYPSRDNVLAFDESSSSLRSTLSLGLNKKPTVTFSEEVLVEETLHANNFTNEEYLSYWVSDEERNVILDMIEITVQLMELGQEEDEDANICYRGLETRTAQGNTYYDTMYQGTILSVLYEQDSQREHGFLDEERIALSSINQTQVCRDFALSRARYDYEEATKVFEG